MHIGPPPLPVPLPARGRGEPCGAAFISFKYIFDLL